MMFSLVVSKLVKNFTEKKWPKENEGKGVWKNSFNKLVNKLF